MTESKSVIERIDDYIVLIVLFLWIVLFIWAALVLADQVYYWLRSGQWITVRLDPASWPPTNANWKGPYNFVPVRFDGVDLRTTWVGVDQLIAWVLSAPFFLGPTVAGVVTLFVYGRLMDGSPNRG